MNISQMDIVLINYGAGNIQSIRFALERLGYQAELSKDADRIAQAEKVIFPGVGEAGTAMRMLRACKLEDCIRELRQPVLGICLGMQLMCNATEEGKTAGLGIFDVDVVKFAPGLKVPQVGWNQIRELRSPLFSGLEENAYMYLVHSYYAAVCEETIAISDYGLPFSAALRKNNFYGLQFHPEKSGDGGEQILKNFLLL